MFFGWRVVAGAFVGMLLANGFFTYAFTILVNPIRAEFDASLEQVMYSLTLGTLGGLLFSPLIGVMIDRYSVRHLMALGGVITAAGLYGVSLTDSIFTFNLGFGLTMALSLGTMSSMTGSAAVSRWFTVNRGKALGIASMGTSVGGVVVPPLLTWWVELEGWRGALQYLALLTLVVVTPMMWALIRNRPQDLGLHPDDWPAPDTQATTAATPVLGTPALGMPQIIRMRSFWLIGLSMGMVFAAFAPMLANLSPYAARLGVGEAAISTMIAVLSLAGLVGKLVFGTGADRVNLKFGLWAAHGLLIAAFSLLLLEPPYWLLLVAAVCFGLTTGGLLPVWNAMVARVFGIDSFGRAMGAMSPLITLSILPAYAVVGRLYDSTGSYSTGLVLFGGIVVIAAALLVPLRLPEADHS
jgi:predicted MFS family arabinose efflux permease